MDTIKRLGENETVRRISNGTLKSYVDREIDTVDTSAFINLETLNVPKAESVTIGEGVKDTLEVLNAPKAEEVAVDKGPIEVNWGKCGGGNDVITTYNVGDPIWIPKAFLLSGGNHQMGTKFAEPSSYPEVGYCTWFGYLDCDGSTARVETTSNDIWINVYRLPQELGKYLYEHAETWMTGEKFYGSSTDTTYYPLYKGIAVYTDNPTSWSSSPKEWGCGIRTKQDLFSLESDGNGGGKAVDYLNRDYSCCYNYTQYKNLQDGYYLVYQTSTSSGNSRLENFNISDTGDNPNHLYLRTWKELDTLPDATHKGSKYTIPSELRFSSTLSNLPNLKVADVHTLDVDVPMFKGCTNLEKVTVGGTKGVEPSLVVNWGKCGGSTDVEVTYNVGDPLWIPNAFLLDGFEVSGTSTPYYKTKSTPATQDEVGYIGKLSYMSGWGIVVYKLPQKFGEWLYENAEDCKTSAYYGLSGGSYDTAQYKAYKGIAIYPDDIASTYSHDYGIGIRKKSDIAVSGWDVNPSIPHINTSIQSDLNNSSIKDIMSDDSIYLVLQFGDNASVGFSFGNYLHSWENKTIYFRHFNTMTSEPSTTNLGERYICSESLCAPTLNPSYFEGCDNLKEVTITNPELRVGNVIPKVLEVNWGKCGGTEDVIVTYKEGEGLWIPKVFFTGSSERMLYSSSSEDYGLLFWTLPKEIGKYLYEKAESNTTDVDDYSTSSTPNEPMNHNYKGIAIYSDTPSAWTSSDQWGVGIRRKSDIGVSGHVRGVQTRCGNADAMESDSRLNDEDYYMVFQDWQGRASTYLDYLSNADVDNGTPSSDHIYLRTYRELTAKPSANNKGEKYTALPELCHQSANFYADETKVPVEAQPFVVNWGKCGGTEDVVVTYNMGDPIWVPTEFFGSASDTAPSLAPEVGFVGDFTIGSSSNYKVRVFKLPQTMGEYLYNNAEDNACGSYDYRKSAYTYSSEERYNYKGIAIYPDTCSSWTYSYGWGVGIRKKSDIGAYGYNSSNVSNRVLSSYNFSSQSTYGLLDDTSYYLVAELTSVGTLATNNLYTWIDNWALSTSHEKIWLRHYNTMTSIPSATNQGKKYTIPFELCRPQKNVYYSKTKKKDSFTVNWGGGQGGTVTYKKGEPLWIPREFLETALDDEKVPISVTEVTGKVGYQCTSSMGNSACPVCIYRLPDNLGEYLYNVAESSNVGYYGKTASTNQSRLYKGIAVYPDTLAPGYDWYDRPSSRESYASEGWGVGIRRKNDVTCEGLASDGTHTEFIPTAFPLSDLPDDGYYLVFQSSGSTQYLNLTGLLQNALDAFGDNRIYFRTWKELTWVPSATNQGSKYTAPAELCTEPLQITMAEYLKENNPNYDFRER